jgi:5-hydroxyisourate hydrolase
MYKISTHVLNIAVGQPADGLFVSLEKHVDGEWEHLAVGVTNSDGRCSNLAACEPGRYRITFSTGEYFGASGQSTLYPEVSIMFEAAEGQSYHIPLLLSPFGYSTYRGS